MDVTLTGPGGLRMAYMDELSGAGGACPPDSQNAVIDSVKPVPGVSGAYMIENSQILGLSDTITKAGAQSSCLLYPTISSKSHSDSQISFGTNMQAQGDNAAGSLAQYPQSDLETARLILLSAQY